MHREWLRRPIAAGVTAAAAAVAIVVARTALEGTGVPSASGAPAIALTAFALALAAWSEYAPRPRRAADRLGSAAVAAGVAVGALALADSLGVAPAPSPFLLLVGGATTAVVVPVVAEQLRRAARSERVVLAGDDAGRLGDAAAALDATPLGRVSPPRLSLASAAPDSLDVDRLRTDGGVADSEDASRPQAANRPDSTGSQAAGAGDSTGAERLSGLSRLQHVLLDRDVDAVVLGYSASDREEFFGALRICRSLGVDVLVHEFHAPATLLAADADAALAADADAPLAADADAPRAEIVTASADGGAATDTAPDGEEVATNPASEDGVQADGGVAATGPVLAADLEPISPQSRVAKRAFDVCFATVGLVVLSPVIVLICVAIALDSPGPIRYGQRRTARLGRTFTLPKFRSMAVDAEDGDGPTLSEEDAGDVDPRVTRVGRVLRRTHLDEIPQLVSVLRGDMTVVGPRPERPALDAEISADGLPWERRWFVKPGLTGLAQINNVTGFEPDRKLAYDLEYVAEQSLLLDVRIVLAQLHVVLADALGLLTGEAE